MCALSFARIIKNRKRVMIVAGAGFSRLLTIRNTIRSKAINAALCTPFRGRTWRAVAQIVSCFASSPSLFHRVYDIKSTELCRPTRNNLESKWKILF